MAGARALLRRVGSRLRRELAGRDSAVGDRSRSEKNDSEESPSAPVQTKRVVAPKTPSVQGFPIFFLLGFAKSGTSWLTRTLNSHPEILCKGEGIFFGRGEDLGLRRGLITPTSLYGALADSKELRGWFEGSIWTRDDDADRHLNNLTRLAIRYVLEEKLAASGKRIVGDKTPFVTEDCFEEIKLLMPEARVIHIVRDGRDIAVSAMHHVWNNAMDAGGHLTIKPEELAKRDAYRKDPETFLAGGESIFDEDRLRTGFAKSWSGMTGRAIETGPQLLGSNYAEVRYEDLLEGPIEEVRRLLEFLGADSDEETARRCVEATSFERMSKRKRGEEDSSSFFRKGVAGDWKNVFTEGDKRIFKEVTGDLLIKLGYEENENW